MTVRPITPSELTKLRKNNQFSRLYLAIHKPKIVFQARINQPQQVFDMVTKIVFDSVTTGNYNLIVPGMTLWIGTSPGARDLGRARIRKPATSDTIYIGETSDIVFADNAYLTVVDEFGIWARHLRIDSSQNIYTDWDIPYTTQHDRFVPVPVMGPPAVAWLTGSSVTVSFDASASWCFRDIGLMEYGWYFPGAVGSSGTNTPTPTATYNAPGVYRVSLNVTKAGETTTGYRYVYVYSSDSMPVTQFTIDNLGGDYERGGWEFDVTLFDEASIQDVQDGAQVILFAKDYYGGVQESLGPVSGRENIIASGWIDGESIEINPIAGRVKFSVRGPQAWLEKISSFPVGFENVANTPTSWTQIQNLTLDKALFSLLFYRSTLLLVNDVILSGDTRRAAALEAPQGSLWSQITMMSEDTIFAKPCCNRYGQLWVQVNQQLIPEADRGAIPTVMNLTKKDWRESINIEYAPIPSVGRVELSGISMASGTPQAYFSLANGHTPKRHGNILIKDRVLLSSQTQSNTLAGLMLSTNNLEWNFSIKVASNNRFVDIAPRQYIDIDIPASDSPRGVEYNDLAIVRSVSADFISGANTLFWNWEAEGVSHETLNTNGDIPIYDTDGNFDFDFSLPPFPIPPLPIPPPLPLPVGNVPRFVFLLTSVGLFYTENFHEVAPTWIGLNEGYSEKDYTDKFSFLDVNQSGRYYVGTEKQIYSGMAGSPAYVVADEKFWLSWLPDEGYRIFGMGCNHAANDEYGVIAGFSYPLSLGRFWLGSTQGFPAVTTLTEYPENPGSISWGKSGIILTYGSGIGFSGRIVKMSFDGLTEENIEYLSGVYGGFFHNRQYNADRFLTIPDGGLKESMFITDDGETIESTLTKNLLAGGYSENAMRLLCVSGTTPYKSEDGGQTFNNLPTFPKVSALNSVIQCMGGDSYVWAMRGHPANDIPGVFFTPDFGSTFQDKTGNLLSITGNSFSMVGLKAFL